MRSSTETLVKALRILSRDIQSDDGVANAAISEAAERLAELERENAVLRAEVKVTRQNYEEYKCENIALREALREIADASGFDNIGNWARNKAKDALKEAKP